MDRAPTSDTSTTAMQGLLVRYVTSATSDAWWEALMTTLDQSDATPDERIAMAAFFRDAVIEFGPGQVKIPKVDEMEGMLLAMRSP